MFEAIPDHATPRKCAVCMRGADVTGFKRSKLGGIDRSTKTHLCGAHAEYLTEPVSPSVQ